jgi:hypothetical protein
LKKIIKKRILLLGLVVFLASPLLFAFSQVASVPKTTVNSDNGQISVSMDWDEYYCDDFEEANHRIWTKIADIYFTYSATSLHYGLFLAAMFVPVDADNATLLIYAFIETLTTQYVSMQSITLTYSLNYTYGIAFDETSGAIGDSTPFMTTSNCMCQYPLYHANFTMSSEKKTLTVKINYEIDCTEFNQEGYAIASASFATMPKIPIMPYFILIGLVFAIFINGLRKQRQLV